MLTVNGFIHQIKFLLFATLNVGSVLASDKSTTHWSFKPIAEVTLPAINDEAWSATDIDRFILRRLRKAGIEPGVDTTKHTWLRRVCFDLTGLPPTLEQIDRFLSDEHPDAKARAVDRLLASSAFGEKWAKHWFDMMCYADSVGSASMPMRHAWRFRDYVIGALNSGIALDEFVRQQIAGDLLQAKSREQRRANLTATGFLAIGPWQLSEQDKGQLRADIIDHQITRIGVMFLGMTLDCARCHDHKFDPVGQRDYYALAGILGNVDVLEGIWRSNLSGLTIRELPETVTDRIAREERIRAHELDFKIAKAKWRKLNASAKKAKTALANTPRGTDEHAAAVSVYQEAVKAAGTAEGDWRFLEIHAPTPPRIHAVAMKAMPDNARINLRGSAHALGDETPRGFIEGIGERASIDRESDGRLELVDWLFSDSNPLTARVYVNRIWARLFGRGLVEPVDYFGMGVNENEPTHPELLDYLARKLQRSGWSLKSLLRELTLSRVYGLSSAKDSTAARRDPENKLWSRANPRRLDSEMIRDGVMLMSGHLNSYNGGPPIPLKERTSLSPGDLVNPPTLRGKFKLTPAVAQARSIYQPVIRSYFHKTQDVLETFDTPNPNQITARRANSASPTHALFLINSPFMKKHGDYLGASALADSTSDDRQRLARLWLRILGRPIREQEYQSAQEFLSFVTDRKKAWARLSHALLASNEFLFIR